MDNGESASSAGQARLRAAPPTRASRSTRRDASTTPSCGPRRAATARASTCTSSSGRARRPRGRSRSASPRSGEPGSTTSPPSRSTTRPASPHRGRVYLAWTRIARNVVFSIVLSHSDNGGRTWSKPVKVREGRVLTYATVATGPTGAVYVAWDDVEEFGIWMARSTDGGAHFRDLRKVASFVAVTIPHCGSGIVIPAQPRTCVNSNPIVSVDTSRGPYSGRVYVSYARTEFRGRQAAHIALFDPRLRRIAPDPETREGRPVAPMSAAREADQFWPQSAVDPSERHGLGVLLRHARGSRAQARVLLVHDLPQRRPDVAPADASGHGGVGRDAARLRSATTATTRVSPPRAVSPTRSGRTRASSPT